MYIFTHKFLLIVKFSLLQFMIPIISCLFWTSEVFHFLSQLTQSLRYVNFLANIACQHTALQSIITWRETGSFLVCRVSMFLKSKFREHQELEENRLKTMPYVKGELINMLWAWDREGNLSLSHTCVMLINLPFTLHYLA